MQFIRLLQPGVSSARIISAGGYFSTALVTSNGSYLSTCHLRREILQHLSPQMIDLRDMLLKWGYFNTCHLTGVTSLQVTSDPSYLSKNHLRLELFRSRWNLVRLNMTDELACQLEGDYGDVRRL